MRTTQSGTSNRVAPLCLTRWAAVAAGLATSVCSGTANAESGYRVCAVEYSYSALGSANRFPRPRAEGRVGLVAKVKKGANSTCNAKTNWMRNEFRRVGVRSIGSAGGLSGRTIDWSTASYGGPNTYSMWSCEAFFSHVQEPNGDQCRALFTTNYIYAYSARQRGVGGPLPYFRYYHN